MIDTISSVPQENDADGDAGGHGVAGEVALRDRQHLGEGIERDESGDAPGADREKISRMKPRIIARRPEISITTSRRISSSVMGMPGSKRSAKRCWRDGAQHEPARRIHACFNGFRPERRTSTLSA